MFSLGYFLNCVKKKIPNGSLHCCFILFFLRMINWLLKANIPFITKALSWRSFPIYATKSKLIAIGPLFDRNITYGYVTCWLHNIYLFKFINRNTRKRCEIRQWHRSGVFIVNFKHISHLFLLFLLMTLNQHVTSILMIPFCWW